MNWLAKRVVIHGSSTTSSRPVNPGAINDLADAFHNAAGCVAEVEDDFQRAKQRFEQGWTHSGGQNPINDSAEVTRATTQLGLQRTQTAVIAADLETVAASLASAQRSSDSDIAALDSTLHAIDDQISAALAAGQDSQSLHQSAVAAVTATLGTVRGIRDTYVASMKAAESAMADSTGYVPDAIDSLVGQPDAAAAAAQRYDQTQRAADEATVKTAGPNSPEGKAAAARLRDYATVTNPAATAEAHRLAGERLSDYTMSKQMGPFQKDPITGSDPVSRAKDRLYMQQVAERSGMSPDRVTAMMDQAEARARTEYPKELVRKLEASGVSEQGAEKLVSDLEQGKGVPEELVRTTQATTGAGEGLESGAKHCRPASTGGTSVTRPTTPRRWRRSGSTWPGVLLWRKYCSVCTSGSMANLWMR